MPVKQRFAKSRRPSFDDDTLELFLRLETIRQETDAFRHGSRELARRLNLEVEWLCQGCHVNDDSAEPPLPPWAYAHDVWFRTRAVRHALLDAVSENSARPAEVEGERLRTEIGKWAVGSD